MLITHALSQAKPARRPSPRRVLGRFSLAGGLTRSLRRLETVLERTCPTAARRSAIFLQYATPTGDERTAPAGGRPPRFAD